MISLIISIISVFIAAIALYNSYFKPALIKINCAERIALWHENGNLGFDIPMIISNTGKKPGVVNHMAIVLYNEKKEENFYITWSWFLKFDTKNKSWELDNLTFPIPIEQGNSIFRCINFISSTCKKNWVPAPGKYKILVLGWSKKGNKPNFSECLDIEIDDKLSKQIKENLDLNKKTCNYIIRKDWGKFESKNLEVNELKKIID